MRKQPPGGRLFSQFFDPFLMASIALRLASKLADLRAANTNLIP
jgi:hypothetical protein